MAARGDLVAVADPVLGPIRQQAPYPRFVGADVPVPAGAPRLGEHNEQIWGSVLGLTPAEIADLRTRGVI